jgi:hypothetical protein
VERHHRGGRLQRRDHDGVGRAAQRGRAHLLRLAPAGLGADREEELQTPVRVPEHLRRSPADRRIARAARADPQEQTGGGHAHQDLAGPQAANVARGTAGLGAAA